MDKPHGSFLTLTGVFGVICAAAGFGTAGCNETSPRTDPILTQTAVPTEETCDGVDNDLDGQVDENFKNKNGIYASDEHCGGCNKACATDDVTILALCAVGDAGPRCEATSCAPGYTISTNKTCVSITQRLCADCLDDGDCGDFPAARCADLGGEKRCTVACDSGTCPSGFDCGPSGLCLPPGGACRCNPGDHFDLSCTIETVDALTGETADCFGRARCDDGILSPCQGSDEICDGIDNDCNGITDDPYVDSKGYYTVDLTNCGACGVDCTQGPLAAEELVCGGPATSPVCAMLCEDSLDGIQPGDMLDADLRVDTGCECRVLSLFDPIGPFLSSGDEIDANCDGADGVVAESFYVIPGGKDTASGSPLTPLKTINEAMKRAAQSIDDKSPRPHVFIAGGTYSEVVELIDGVHLHGGYSPDFNTRDTDVYETVAAAPAWQSIRGGAAVVAAGVGIEKQTFVDGITFRGASTTAEGGHAFGAYFEDCGDQLIISNVVFEAGTGSDGANGQDEGAGTTATTSARSGDKPRAAYESPSHDCIIGPDNTVSGGAGATWLCDGIEVTGGRGGDAECPLNNVSYQTEGEDGSGDGGGSGGDGGWNSRGPMTTGPGRCPYSVFCGLADFEVTTDYAIAEDGGPGDPGGDGTPGERCAEPLGKLFGTVWFPSIGKAGRSGNPGSGGGGGGAGGGAVMEWISPCCTYADGLGGGGGGGGAGGCGGAGGKPGSSGGPSIAVVVRQSNSVPEERQSLVMRDCVFRTASPGDGGSGGHGGDGGQGTPGAPGGSLEPQERTTPSLAGSSFGGAGGPGGAGGRGGGGGGGCGGSSVGLWFSGGSNKSFDAKALISNNTFELASPGAGGLGGGGESALKGASGEVRLVVEK